MEGEEDRDNSLGTDPRPPPEGLKKKKIPFAAWDSKFARRHRRHLFRKNVTKMGIDGLGSTKRPANSMLL